MYTRNCPNCNKELHYKNEKSLKCAIKKNKNCRSCVMLEVNKIKYPKKEFYVYERNCPECNTKIVYKKEYDFTRAKIKNTKCKSCATTERMNRKEEKIRYSTMFSGKNNPMYGKSIYDIWLEKYGKVEADKRQKEWENNLICWGRGIPNPAEKQKGKTYEELYGKEKAEKIKQKLSYYSGERCAAFGKPAPIGSGRG